MASVRHYIQRIKEGRLKQIMGEVLWMYAYVRRYWLLIGVYILLGASGSVLGLGTSVVSKDLVDAITGVNSMEIVRVAGTYVGVGVSQIFINAVKSRLSLKVRLKVTNEIRGDIYEQVLRTNWESLAKYRSGDLLYRVNGDAGMVANTIPLLSSCSTTRGWRSLPSWARPFPSSPPGIRPKGCGTSRGRTRTWPATARSLIRRPSRTCSLSRRSA